jgi:hypothetical protein
MQPSLKASLVHPKAADRELRLGAREDSFNNAGGPTDSWRPKSSPRVSRTGRQKAAIQPVRDGTGND